MKVIENSAVPNEKELRTVAERDGIVVVRQIEPFDEAFAFQANLTYWVKTPEGTAFEFDEEGYRKHQEKNRYQAHTLGELWSRSGGFEITDSHSVIPVKIAVMGKPSMAAYLDTIHSVDHEKIGNMLDTTEETVEQYISKFRYGRR
jgi:hypothetical protein